MSEWRELAVEGSIGNIRKGGRGWRGSKEENGYVRNGEKDRSYRNRT
jgi:hypothetical protein